MTRGERGIVVLCLALAVVVASLAVFASAWLNGQGWFGASANVVQLISAPGLFAAVAVAAWARWHRTCAVPWCLRSGEHPVGGTLRKVCAAHHTLEHHELVHDLHGAAHALSGRLGWGESHDRPEASAASGSQFPRPAMQEIGKPPPGARARKPAEPPANPSNRSR
jgi:hypothetical protein